MWESDPGYNSDVTYYTVKFTDGLGKTLKTQQVEEGDDATPPAAPKRDGYKFVGWDDDYTDIWWDVTINAEWEKASTPDKPAAKSVTWTRLAGDNAFKTMSKVIDAGKFAKGGTVVLASLEGYWDALTAAGIAGLEKAPVVMSTPDGLSAEAKAQLKKLAPKKIVVCGGTYWLPQKVLDQAKAAAGTSPAVVRLAGSNAAATAEKIAAQGAGSWSGTAIVATAGTFQDALAAAPIAWAKKMPIFLAQFDSAKGSGYISKSTINAMKDVGIKKCYIAGGTYWIPKKVEDDLKAAGITVIKRLGGKTAVETSGLIAQEAVSALGMKAEKMGVANVAQHYDALASASFCGKANSVLVLVKDSKSSVISGFVKSSKASMTKGYVFGGTGSVSEASMNALKAATK